MAFYTMRINLSAAAFPFLTEFGGRTIIVPGPDENYDRQIASTADQDKDKGVPQAYYMHNVLPSSQGLQSVGTKLLLAPANYGATDFGSVLPIQTLSDARILLVPAGGVNYIYDATVGTSWNTNSSFPAGTVRENIQVTIAFIHSETYIYYANYGCFRYDTTTKVLTPVVLAGLVATDLVGICASNGYMLAWTNTGIAWSSLIDPTDFVPSLTTGAGGGNLNEAIGNIIACFPIAGGFIAYCEQNAVACKSTSNVNFPFAFNQIPGAGSITSPEQVSWQATLPDHYAWTNAGLQQVNLAVAKNVLPDVSDFFAAKLIEEFDPATNSFSTTTTDSIMQTLVSVIGMRYIVISYGNNYPDFDYAFVYDLVIKRFGKVKIKHRDCFQWNYPNLYGDITYAMLGGVTPVSLAPSFTYSDFSAELALQDNEKESFAFIQADGSIYRLDFSLDRNNGDGVLLLGKYQFQRNLMITHLSTEMETVNGTDDFDTLLVPSLNGKDLKPAVSMYKDPPDIGSKLRIFKNRNTAKNHSLLLKGTFNLTTGIIVFTTAGTR